MAEDRNGKDETMRLLTEFIEGLRAQRRLQKSPPLKKVVDVLVRLLVLEEDAGTEADPESRALEALKNLLDIKMERKERGAAFDAKSAKLAAFDELLKGI